MPKEKKNDGAGKHLLDVLFFPITKNSIIQLLFAFAVNIIGNYISVQFSLPISMDVFGTVFAAVSYGPIAGVLVGGFSSLLICFLNNIPSVYAFVSVVIALAVGMIAPRIEKKNYFSIISLGYLCGVLSAFLKCPLNLTYYDGYTNNKWGNALYDLLRDSGSNPYVRAIAAEVLVVLPDRLFAALLAFFLNENKHMSMRIQGKKKTKALSLLLVFVLVASVFPSGKISAADYESDYETVTFGSEDGIPAPEVNAVIQTEDGYMWAGTYSGLYKFDGARFWDAEVDDRIKSVMRLFTDSKGRLWIGTNDSGVFCYDIDKGSVTVYNSDNGLGADSVRAISEDVDGNIYIGTVLATSKISPDGVIKTYNEWEDVYYVQSFASMEDGSMVGVTNGGVLFLLKDDLLLDEKKYEKETGVTFRSVACSGDAVVVGTSSVVLERYHIVDGKIDYDRTYSLKNSSFVNRLVYSRLQGGFFYCCEDGMGFLDEETGEVSEMQQAGFNGAVSDVCVDNQNNIWFASSKQGLLRYSKTPFKNMFQKAGIESSAVNAVICDGETLLVGTDTGMRALNIKTCKQLDLPYLSDLQGIRIRNIMKDSKGNIWVSAYGNAGLYCVDKVGKVITLPKEYQDAMKGRCRLTMELSDGRILVATNTGLYFLKDYEVDLVIDEKNGLNNQYILSIAEREDGTILAASDGDGIYIIKDDRVVGHIGKSEGLNSLVVLKIVKGSEGYFYVTSNAIYYDDGETVRELKNFPYSNNYDIQITDDKRCLITSSAGLYVVPEETLIEDGVYECTLLNERWGLETSFTAVAWNYMQGGELYLCCVDGVRMIKTENYYDEITGYRLLIDSVECGDEVLHEKNGMVMIPATMDRISFNVAVTNYTLSNLRVRYFLEGTSDAGITCYQSELTPLVFTKLPKGDYKLHIQVLDENTGTVQKESVYKVHKDPMFYENIVFRCYVSFVVFLILLYIFLLIRAFYRHTASLRFLQREVTIDPMTGLLNKAGSKAALTKACKSETGLLMMIDLDSFKLVNDLYGHDMGDRILIRFAELIREILKEEDIAGRLGGDEFVGFAGNTMDEDIVEKLAKHLNRELVKSAKEYMGNDMNIPLGASIGAVQVPAAGTDYEELLSLADKALYVVKQNGKHGYYIYQKKGETKTSEGQEDKNNLAQIKKIIGERNEGKGAFEVNFDRMQVLYKYLNRVNAETETKSGFLRLSLKRKGNDDMEDTVKEAFEDYVVRALRKNDVVTDYADSLFILCMNQDEQECEALAKSLVEGFLASGDYAEYAVAYETEKIG